MHDLESAHQLKQLNGTGYPDGLSGDDLTTEVGILGACGMVEAMSTRRPNREVRSKEMTVGVLKEEPGDKLDPKVVKILLKLIKAGEINFISAKSVERPFVDFYPSTIKGNLSAVM